MKMRKLVAVLMAVMMLCCIIPFSSVAADTQIVFEFGANGSAAHVDGNDATSYSETNGAYTLSYSDGSKVYKGAYDAKGNSCLKMGTSSVVGSFSFDVPAEVTSVIISVAKYKAKDSQLDVNGTSYTLSSSSNDGAYEQIVVDTTSTKTVTLATVSGKTRVMINSITYVIGGGAPVIPEEPEVPEIPEEPDTPVEPETPVVPGNPDGTIVLDLTNKDNRTSYSSTKQVWEQNGITVTNDKGASTTNVGDYANPGRFYKSSTVTIAYPGMTSIVIDSVTFDDNDYAAAWAVLDDANATATVTDGDVIIEFASPVNSITWAKLSSQVRAYTITIYTEGATPELPEKPETPDTPSTPAGDVSIVTEPDVDVAYKLGLEQTQKGAVYYFTGKMSNYYGATETDLSLAVDMYLENAGDGYKLYFNDANGAKQYIALVQSGTYYNFTFGATGSVFSWDADRNALYTTVGDEVCYMGTYGSYVTMGVLRTSKLVDTDYIARLYTVGGETPDTPDAPDTPDTPVTPDEPTTGEWGVITELQAGVAYKLGLDQTQKGAIYYFTGKMSNYYGATETDLSLAVDMYVEIVSGGYKLYFNDANGAKQYINLVQSGTYYNFTFGATGSVFSWDADRNALYTTVGDEVCYMGTYGSYVTMGVLRTSKLVDTDYIARLYGTVGGSAPDAPACEHEYDDEYDADCNKCGETREVPEKPIEYTGTIEIGTVEGSIGDTVDVAVTLPNNPGVISVKVKVHFDNTVLKVTACQYGEFNGMYGGSASMDEANEKGYIIIDWFNGLGANSTAELLATLSFQILEGAAEEISMLTLEFSCEDNIFDANENTVYLQAVNGGVVVVPASASEPGDANGDGVVNNRDLALIQQYINKWDVSIDVDAMDVNDDGAVNNRDMALIQQYINKWDVVLK